MNTQHHEVKLSFFKSMKGKLLLWFLALALLPLAGAGFIAYSQAQAALQQSAYDKLQAVQAIKKHQIELYFDERAGDMGVLVETVKSLHQEAIEKLDAVKELKQNEVRRLFEGWQDDVWDVASDPDVVAGSVALADAFESTGASRVRSLYQGQPQLETANDNSDYSDQHQRQHAFFSGYAAIHGYPDALLIDPTGNVIYSSAKNDLFGTNLAAGPYQDSNLARLYSRLKAAPAGEVLLADAALLNEEIAMFMGTPVYQGGRQVGILVYQLPFQQINAILQERTGMGNTGETYLIAKDTRGRISFRSDLQTMGHGQYVVGYDVTDIATPYVLAALEGQSGQEVFIDSNDNPALVSFEPMGLPDLTWAIVAKVDAAEALVPAGQNNEEDYFTRYTQLYDYYDLFLINADGYIFYSVSREDDYQTNMATGQFNSSNLGRLVQNIINTRTPGLADFEPYAPSNNLPAAFIGYPVSTGDQLDYVVALQLSLQDINNVMQERTGLGETGETYLVGNDMRMRSDSFLNPTSHSVIASFAGTVENNGVDTVASRAALSGESGTQIINDYRDQPVLSAFTPLSLNGLNWAIISEIDVDEAFSSVTTLRNIMLVVAIVTALTVAGAALWVANSLANPISKITRVAQAVTRGNLDVSAEVQSKDETGLLAAAFNQMVDILRQRIKSEEEASQKANQLALAERSQKEYLEHTVDGYLTFVQQVSAGDLTGRLQLNGHEDALTILGANLNQMVERLSEMTSQIRQATSNIAAAAAEILAATTQQSSGASQQSSAISQTTTTIDEVKTIVEQAFNKAQAVSEQARHTADISQVGQGAVVESINGMTQIKERVEGIAENILDLSKHNQQIGEIISTVNEIAWQSNLLALNASVEAARAGENGKGFAVVAVEVRNLAEQSKQSTGQIKTILNEIQRATNNAVMATEEGTKGVDMGVHLTEQAGQTIHQLAESVSESASSAQQIVASAQQQTSGMEQIALAMQNINQATVQNMASTRQAERAAQDLLTLAQQMEQLVAQYKLNAARAG